MKLSRKKKIAIFGIFICFILTCVAFVKLMHLWVTPVANNKEDVFSQYYVMITDDYKSSFWKSVYQGAYEKGLENNIYVEMLGEHLNADYTKEDLMEIAIASKVDGLIVAANDEDELTELINKASKKNIPVVTVFGDNTRSERLCFVGVGSYNLGREYGKKVLEIIGSNAMQQKREPIQISVIVNSYAKDYGQNILCSGIQETIATTQKNVDIQMNLVSVDDTNVFSVEESIRDLFMGEKLPDIIICMNELNTNCVYQAVVDYNKVGQVHILGYYDSEMILKGIERNVIDATVAIDTRQMGIYCVSALKDYVEHGYTSQYLSTDVTVIDANNVTDWINKNQEITE